MPTCQRFEGVSSAGEGENKSGKRGARDMPRPTVPLAGSGASGQFSSGIPTVIFWWSRRQLSQ
jgi:hypothetical protein